MDNPEEIEEIVARAAKLGKTEWTSKRGSFIIKDKRVYKKCGEKLVREDTGMALIEIYEMLNSIPRSKGRIKLNIT